MDEWRRDTRMALFGAILGCTVSSAVYAVSGGIPAWLSVCIVGTGVWAAHKVLPPVGDDDGGMQEGRLRRDPPVEYPAEVVRGEDGRYVVTFPDFGWGATDGATLDEALAEARDLLRELIAATTRDGGDLPEPSRTTGHQVRAALDDRLLLQGPVEPAIPKSKQNPGAPGVYDQDALKL